MKFFPAYFIPALWLRFAACLLSVVFSVIGLKAQCSPGGETSLAMDKLEVLTKSVDGVCLKKFNLEDNNGIHRKRTTIYQYTFSIYRSYGASREYLNYKRQWTKTETYLNDGSDAIETVIEGSGSGSETVSTNVGGQWKDTERNSFEFQQRDSFISGTYSSSTLPCNGTEWVTNTEPYTEIWPEHFPESGFVPSYWNSFTFYDDHKELEWTYTPGSGETGYGKITKTITLSEKDTFRDAIAREGGIENGWVPSSLATAQWGSPYPSGSPPCISGGSVCKIRALFEGCPGEYEAKLRVISRPFDSPGAPWSSPITTSVTFKISDADAASGWISFVLPMSEGRLFMVDPSKGIVVRALPAAGPSGEKSCSSPYTNSAHFDLCLGHTREGRNAGFIGFHTESLTSASFTPAALSYNIFADDGSVELHETGGVVDEVYALETDAKIETVTDGFVVKFYKPVVDGTKFVDLVSSWQFKRVTPGDNSQMEIKRLVGGTETYVFGHGSNGWSLTRDGTIENLDTSQTNIEIRTIKGSGTGDPIVFKEKTTYDLGTAGQRRIIEQVRYSDVNTPAETTTWHYYSGSDLLEYVEYPNGSWQRYTYNTAGEVIQAIGPWRDSLRTDTNLASHHYYETTRDQITIASAQVNRETRVEKIAGQEVGRTYRLVWDDPVALDDPDVPDSDPRNTRQIWEVRVSAPGLAWDATGNYITKYNHDLLTGELRRSIEPDGTTTWLSYQRSISGGYRTTERVRGGPRPALNRVLETNAAGSVVFEETTDNAVEYNAYLRSIGHSVPFGEENLLSNRVISSKIATDFENDDPERGKPTTYVYLDGSFENFTYACCGRVTYHLDRNGLETNYTYDSRGRLVAESRGASSTNYPYHVSFGTHFNVYDAAGRLVQVDREVSGSPGQIMQSQTGYDLAGRVVWEKDALSRQTNYSYATATGGGRVRTTTRQADGATNIETSHRDGQVASLGGTAVPPQKYLYGTNTQGQRWRQDIRLGAGASETEWGKTYTDMLGRTAKEEYPDGAVSTYAYSSGTGSSFGTYAVTDPDGVVTSEGSSDLYLIAERALPLGSYGDPAVYVSVHRTIKDGTYTDVSMDGLKTWIVDSNGLTTTVETELANDPAALLNRTVTTTAPDGTLTVRTYIAGKISGEIRKDSAGTTVSEVRYDYDEHGRLWGVSRTGGASSSYTYHDDDQIASISGSDPDPTRSGTGYDTQTTSYGYDSAGRRSLVTQPDGTEVHTTYWPTGQVKRTWGSRMYPSEYSYDTQGRVKTLTTWKDFAAQAGAAVTTWNYHAQRGWLSSKVYDGSTAGPAYTYWPSGRLKTRTWARGITATYSYNSAWGKLSGISYSDGTPSVAYTYTADGKRLKTIQDAAGTLTYDYRYSTVPVGDVTYHPDGSLTQETYAGGLLGSRVLSHGVDSLGRPGGVVVNAGGTQELSVAWAYDLAGRLQTITEGQITGTLGYQANTEALQTIFVKQSGTVRLATSRTLDEIGRVAAVAFDNPAPGLLAERTYTYNSANQRTRVEQEDTRRWAYGYDGLGQVNLAEKRLSNGSVLPGYAFAFDYDDIGNRESATANGQISHYMTDSLNRYQARGTPLWADVRGKALSQVVSEVEQVTVLVNEEPATRTGEDFYRAVPVLGLKENELKIQAVRPSPQQAVTENRSILVPTVPEAFAYDADGNLTGDGLWLYEWDGENRLKAQELRPDVVTSTWKRLEYAYDGQSRRIQKVVKTRTSAGGAWTTASDTRFLYDGWNLVAEYNYASSVFTLLRSHAWGIDLSGSTQGAGGVGGLLWTKVAASGKTYAAGSDANGNVVLYVDCSDGSAAGRRDYGAFGEAVLTIGVAGNLPFGFSTKYEEKEAGLYYYGYRHYNSSTGRWLGKDPIDEQGGLNLYAMLDNKPINNWDLLGLSPGDEYETQEAAEIAASKDVWDATNRTVLIGEKAAEQEVHLPFYPGTFYAGDYYIFGRNRNGYYSIFGIEHATIVYCIKKDGKSIFSYGELVEGTLPSEADFKKGLLGRTSIIKAQNVHRNHMAYAESVTWHTGVHSHNMKEAPYNDPGDEFSIADKNWVEERSLALILVADSGEIRKYLTGKSPKNGVRIGNACECQKKSEGESK